MGYIGIHGADFVFHEVRHPVFAASASYKAVVCQCGCPFDIGACMVVGGIGKSSWRFCHKAHEQPFGKAVGDFDAWGGGEVTFENMSHHVHDAHGRLIGRQGKGHLGIDYCEARPQDAVGAQRKFHGRIAFGYHAVSGAFASAAGDGEHNAYGKCLLDLALAGEKVPEVAGIRYAGGDGFGGVNHAASADGYKSVDILGPSQADSFVDKCIGGVGLHSTQFDMFNA